MPSRGGVTTCQRFHFCCNFTILQQSRTSPSILDGNSLSRILRSRRARAAEGIDSGLCTRVVQMLSRMKKAAAPANRLACRLHQLATNSTRTNVGRGGCFRSHLQSWPCGQCWRPSLPRWQKHTPVLLQRPLVPSL